MRCDNAKSYFLLTALLISLGGCKTHSEPEIDIALPGKFHTGSIRALETDPTLETWWENFLDPAFTALVERGLHQNISLQQARERLDLASLRQKIAGSNLFPTLQASANTNLSNQAEADSDLLGANTSGGLQFSWFLDIFGGNKHERKSSQAEKEAAAIDIQAVRLAYLADLTISYIDLRYYRETIAISRQNFGSYSQTLKLTKQMREAGTASNLAVAQAQALVDGAKAETPPLNTEMHKALNRIATILGTTASEISGDLSKSKGQPRLGKLPHVGIPADLLRNRPDIKREEYRLKAAAEKIGVAEAQLYPALALTGNIDIARLVAKGLSSTDFAWAFGSSILAPIFDGGRLRANVDLSKVASKVQYLNWKDTVLRAMEDVENAALEAKNGSIEVSALARKVRSYRRSLDLARQSYKGGSGVLLEVLEAERSLAAAKLEHADSRRRYAIAGVRLYVSIGGGAAVNGSAPLWKPEKLASGPINLTGMTHRTADEMQGKRAGRADGPVKRFDAANRGRPLIQSR